MNPIMHYKIHEEIRLVKGFLRGIAYDLNRNNYDFLPNEIIDILEEQNGGKFDDLKKNILAISDKEITEEYIDFLLDEEYIFLIEKEYIPLFTDLNLEWCRPCSVYCALLDISDPSLLIHHRIIEELENLGCRHLLFRFSKDFNFESVSSFLTNYKNSGFYSFNVWIDCEKNKINNAIVEDFCEKNPKVLYLNLFNYKGGKRLHLTLPITPSMGYYLGEWEDSTDYLSNQYCFRVDISLFLEALTHNTYFNQKIYIDKDGFISNAPGCPTVGNIRTTKIENILTDDFKVLWTSNKDQTSVCKDCEYRYMCEDNRLPSKREDGSYYFEKECNYNPYIAKWSDQDGFIHLGNFITNNQQEFIIDLEKVNLINEKLHP